MKKILCITPITHLEGVMDMFKEYGEVIYEPNIKQSQLNDLLISTQAEYLFTNPNKQGFMLDEEVLNGSFIKAINTCSTGTNHIDIDFCASNGIKIWSLKNDMELINDLPSTSELAFGLMISLFRKINAVFIDIKSLYNSKIFIDTNIKHWRL